MKNKTFLVNAMILTLTSLFLRIADTVFTVFLSNKIGAEGIGLYQLVSSIYVMATILALSGISVAVTRLTAESIGKGSQAAAIVRRCIVYATVISVTVMILLFNLSDFIATALLNDARTILSIKIMALSLPFMAVSACFRGYFLGSRKVLKSASSSIFEEIIRIGIITAILHLFLPRGLEYACCAIILGSLGSEIFACGYAFVLYRIEKRQDNPGKKQKGIFKKVISISLPVACSSYLRVGLRTAESILIPLSLVKFGLTRPDALAKYGLVTGMVMPVISFPTAFLFSVASLLMPEIAKSRIMNDQRRLNDTIVRVFRLTLLLSILFSSIFIFFSDSLGGAIYQSREAGEIMRILAPLVPLMYLDIIVDSMLNGLNQQIHSLQYNISDSVVRILLIFFLVPLYGLNGFLAAIYIGSTLNSFLSIHRLVKVSEVRIEPGNWILKPLLAAITAGSSITLLFKLIAPGSFGTPHFIAFAVLTVIAVYIRLLSLTGCISTQDISWLKSLLIRSLIPKKTQKT